jgi:protoporphyrin/coproporphyrin ferrochelatase
MKAAVLLLAHGAPERVEDVGAYLDYVRPGRPLPAPVFEEIKQRYALIGGGSPLLDRTRSQAEALAARLDATGWPVQVYFGMRNWHPFIQDTMSRMQADGVRRIVAMCLAPQYSKLSVGFYFRRAQEAKNALGFDAEIVWTRSFHDHPRLVEAFAEKLAPLLPAERVLFTAHSLPEKILEQGDRYDTETRGTASLVAARLGLAEYDFAYQSQGLTDDKWLGPTVESRLDAYAAAEVRRVAVAPIGFVSDHVEVLYDVDILFRGYAAARGIEIARAESLNDSPAFIDALAQVAAEKLGAV